MSCMFFFFKQKTAYEMRISDWSSDVCSSDLDPDNEYFVAGMQDLILTRLAGIGDLKVISRTSTEKYSSHPTNLKQIAQELGVAHIVEGSVQKVGNDVLISVQLVDAQTDHHLWAESYQRTLDDIFGVEGEVAGTIAAALQAKLTASEASAVTQVPTTNPREIGRAHV